MGRRKKRVTKTIDLKSQHVYMFTDGACWPTNGGNGGWGVVLLFNGHCRELQGSQRNTTNNKMELMAILEGLRALKRPMQWPVTVYSDSQYCVKSLTTWWPGWSQRGWRTAAGGDVKNLDLIKAILEQVGWESNQLVSFKWLPGHAGIKYNERADELAVAGRIACKDMG